MILVVMGAAGAGKTTVGRALAERLRWRFVDADQFHSAASRDTMSRGIGLTEDDRLPWLAQLHAMLCEAAERDDNVVLACSALAARHRALLAGGLDVRWVLLRAERTLLYDRLSTRSGHFAGPALLDSQLAALEPPADAIVIDARKPVHVQVGEIATALGTGIE